MKVFGYLRVVGLTTLNIVANGATLGRYVWLEGRVEGGVFRNWARRFRYAPKKFVKPNTEQEIIGLIQNARRVRVFGSGHSFNAGVVSDEVLMSLDDYSGLVWKDLDKKQLAVRAVPGCGTSSICCWTRASPFRHYPPTTPRASLASFRPTCTA